MRQDVQMMCLRITSGKKIVIENGVGGALVATATRVDAPEPALIEDRAQNTSDDQMEFGEKKHTPRSDAEMFGPTDIMHSKLLEMQVLCLTVQDVGARMDGRFAEEGQKKDSKKICC